jgi:hypothetical protein
MEQESVWMGRDVVNALLLVLVGAVVCLVGIVAFSVVGEYWNAGGDAAQAALIDSERVQFAVAFGLQGLGTVIVGSGLFMLGRAIAPIEAHGDGRRRATAALLAGWFGVVVGLGGLSGGLHAIFATPEFYVDSMIETLFVVVGGLGLVVSAVAFGVLAWAASPPKWTAGVLAIGGLATAVGIPDIIYVVLVIFCIANLLVLRSGARTVPARTTAP